MWIISKIQRRQKQKSQILKDNSFQFKIKLIILIYTKVSNDKPRLLAKQKGQQRITSLCMAQNSAYKLCKTRHTGHILVKCNSNFQEKNMTMNLNINHDRGLAPILTKPWTMVSELHQNHHKAGTIRLLALCSRKSI